ncbi:DUF3047 domain-containing protein [Amphritea sp.]|uniref:DUF3047 domain-containing protein n=1 Tax=Amphritea sp. TaxID=1872502 RepID=UPI003D137A9A
MCKVKMPNIYSIVSASILLFVVAAAPTQASPVSIPGFDPQGITQWEHKHFSGETHYTLTSEGDNPLLEARSDGSASGLYYKKTITIDSKTNLSWRWKISKTWPSATETTKAGDDFPVRVYIVVSDGPFFWQKRTLVYVWSNNQPVDSRWPNPFTDRALMWAVDSGDKLTGQWTRHSRNLQNDLQIAFAKTYTEIEAIAIMTDSDNGGTNFLSWYDDIALTESK